MNRRVQAAIVIQRAFRSHLRLKKRGISTTQILARKQIEDYGSGAEELPTRLMENLLAAGASHDGKANDDAAKDAWTFDDEFLDETPDLDYSFAEEDDDDDTDTKIPKKTEIFEG